MTPVRALGEVLRQFGSAAAQEKLRLLREVAGQTRCSVRELALLQKQLGFLLAYPDNAQVRRAAESLSEQLTTWVQQHLEAGRGDALEESGLPGTTCRRFLSHALTREFARLLESEINVDWEQLEERADLHDSLAALVLSAEGPALDDINIGTRDWLEGRAARGQNGLCALLDVFDRSPLPSGLQAALYETCAAPLRLDDPQATRGRNALRFPAERVHYQRKPIPRESGSIAPHIRRELRDVRRLSASEGRARLDRTLLLMGNRELEIFPLTHADGNDVQLIPCGRGIEILLTGVRFEQRCAFESLYYYIVTKNGVAIAYGPASPFLGSCEMGINFFEEFRGAETRYIYTQVMRVLYHQLGVRNFYVTPYGMGKGNAAALATGAFWFYRKLGFAAANPAVEELAQQEEVRVRNNPRHRSDRKTLRKLSDTAAFLDLSQGKCPRFDSSGLALAVSASLQKHGKGKRADFEERCARQLALGSTSNWSADERTSLRRMAPALCLIPGLAKWPRRDRQALARIVRDKAARSETQAATRMLAHRRLASGLREVSAVGSE